MKISCHVPSFPPYGIWLGEAVVPWGFEEIETLTTVCSLTNKPRKSVKQNNTSSFHFTFLFTLIRKKNTANMKFFKGSPLRLRLRERQQTRINRPFPSCRRLHLFENESSGETIHMIMHSSYGLHEDSFWNGGTRCPIEQYNGSSDALYMFLS